MADSLFACPGCHQRINVADELIGKFVACPHCGAQFGAIPDTPTETYDAVPVASADYTSPSQPKTMLVGWIIAGGCIVVAGLILLIATVNSGQPPKAAPRQAIQPIVRNANSFDDASSNTGWMTFACVLWVIGLLYIVALILILAWVAKDARNRNMDGGAMWVIVVLFLHVIGLLVYLASRPHGVLCPCVSCGNKRLMSSRLCPHCGNK